MDIIIMIHNVRLNAENQKHFTTGAYQPALGLNFFLDLSVAKYIKSQLSENK